MCGYIRSARYVDILGLCGYIRSARCVDILGLTGMWIY